MKPWIILIAVAVTTMVAATLVVPMLGNDASAGRPPEVAAPTVEAVANAPHVEVDEPLVYEFPTMAQDTDDTHSWTFRNTGKSKLALTVNGTDCSCTIAEAEKEIPPGGSKPVQLKWNSRKIDGAYRKNARIGTNDPSRPEITLTVQGKVYPAVIVVPNDLSLNYMTVTNDEDVVRKAAIYSKDRPGMKITKVSWLNKALLDVKVEPMTEEERASFQVDSGYMLSSTLRPTDRLGAINEEIVVATDHPQKPDIRLKVAGKVTGPITVVPEKVVLRDATSSGGGAATVIVWVRGRSSAEFAVEKAPPGFEVAFAPIPQAAGVASSKYRMTVRIAPGTPAGKVDGEVVVRTDHPKAAELRVPVDALIRGDD